MKILVVALGIMAFFVSACNSTSQTAVKTVKSKETEVTQETSKSNYSRSSSVKLTSKSIHQENENPSSSINRENENSESFNFDVVENPELEFNLLNFLETTYPILDAHYEISQGEYEPYPVSVLIVPDTTELVTEFLEILAAQDGNNQLYQYYSGIAYEIIHLPIELTGILIDAVGIFSREDNLSHIFIQTYK
ncbi:MAG: hypothetical protein ACTH2R_09420 [Vagococcus salmoninarum]